MTMMTMDNLTQPVCGSNMEAHDANGGNGMLTASDFTTRAAMPVGHQQQRRQQRRQQLRQPGERPGEQPGAP